MSTELMTADAFIAAVNLRCPCNRLGMSQVDAIRAAWAALPTPTLVEVTGEDVEHVMRDVDANYEQDAATINARLRARAADTSPRIVRRPSRPGVSQLVVPEDGEYFRKFSDGWQALTITYAAGTAMSDAIGAIQRYDEDTLIRGPIIERTKSPAVSEWSADDIPDGPCVTYGYDREPSHVSDAATDTKARADYWNRLGVTAYVLVPSEVPV